MYRHCMAYSVVVSRVMLIHVYVYALPQEILIIFFIRLIAQGKGLEVGIVYIDIA